MKLFQTIFLVLLLFSFAKAQDSLEQQIEKAEFPECYVPTDVGRPIQAKVIEILSGNKIFVSTKEGDKTVEVASIKVKSNKNEARNFLEKSILNKEVELFIMSGNYEDGTFDLKKNLVAYVKIERKDIGKLMIGLGLAQYKNYKKNTFYSTHYDDCAYPKLEKQARKEKRGIWAK